MRSLCCCASSSSSKWRASRVTWRASLPSCRTRCSKPDPASPRTASPAGASAQDCSRSSMPWKLPPRTSCCNAFVSSSEGPPRSATGAPASRSLGARVVDCTCLSRASPSASKTGMIAASQPAGRRGAKGCMPRATDRSRRSPTRSWCTCSGSALPRAISAALGRICARQDATMPSSIVSPSIARVSLALHAGARALAAGLNGLASTNNAPRSDRDTGSTHSPCSAAQSCASARRPAGSPLLSSSLSSEIGCERPEAVSSPSSSAHSTTAPRACSSRRRRVTSVRQLSPSCGCSCRLSSARSRRPAFASRWRSRSSGGAPAPS